MLLEKIIKVSPYMIMAGGLIGVFGILLPWTIMDVGSTEPLTITGIGIIKGELSKTGLTGSYLPWLPVIVLIASLAALIIGLVANKKKHWAILIGTDGTGISILIAWTLFFTYSETVGTEVIYTGDCLGVGFWLEFVAAFVIIGFGGMIFMGWLMERTKTLSK